MSSRENKPPKFHLPLRTILSNTATTPISNSIRNVGSPMTHLAFNLSELSTGRCTPKRRLSLSSVDTPTDTSFSLPSLESGCFADSPSPLDSPTLEELGLRRFSNIYCDNNEDAIQKCRRNISFQRTNSVPVPFPRFGSMDYNSKESLTCSPMNLSPFKKDVQYYHEDSSSQDSGVGMDKDKDDAFQFTAPVGMPPRKLKIINEDACSPQKYSPIKHSSPSRVRSFSCIEFLSLDSCDSPGLMKSVLTSTNDDSDGEDDGFLDVIDKDVDKEVAEITNALPRTMYSLFSAPVIDSNETLRQNVERPIINRRPVCRRLLQRSRSVDVRTRVVSSKRDPPSDNSTPVQNKRQRMRPMSSEGCSPPKSPECFKLLACHLQRCHSQNEIKIKSALSKISIESDLIGDCSKPYILPTIPGKHQDLKSITAETMSAVLNGEYDHYIEKCHIADCRYPYEYQGGHIKNAKNLYTKATILDEFLKNPKPCSNKDKRNVVIFHCEFSSERGPKLSRFLRNKDRDCNKECYPSLHHPELYLLDAGYKAFFEQYKHQCEPQDYKPMLHKDHANDLKHFRAKSKSWGGEEKVRPGMRPIFY